MKIIYWFHDGFAVVNQLCPIFKQFIILVIVKASINVEEFKDAFISYQTYLQNEYTDSIERYERLTEKDSQLVKEEAEIEVFKIISFINNFIFLLATKTC